MNAIKNKLFNVVLFFALTFFCTGVQNCMAGPEKYRTSPDPVAVMADGVLVRPLGVVSTVIGSVFYVITLPFTIPSDSADTARQQLVEYPAWFTFQRPIGNFGHRYKRANIIEEKRALAKGLEEERTKEKQKDSRAIPPPPPPEVVQ